jgi:hypothetical protein
VPRDPFLQPMFRVTSTRRNPTFGDCPPSAVGKPADVRLPDPPRTRVSALPRKTPDHLAVIRPPTAARLTARRRLRASRLPPWSAPSRGVGESAAALSAVQLLRRSSPLTPLLGDMRRGAGASLACRVRPVHPGHVNATGLSGPEVPSTGEDRASALSRARRSAAHAGRRGSRRTLSSMFENTD